MKRKKFSPLFHAPPPTEWAIDLEIAWVRTSDDPPSRANTQRSSISRSSLSMDALAPERYATLAQAACKARSSREGTGKVAEFGDIDVVFSST
jgi:hypothetical protein